ncbi:MAG: LPXTG cell wall anchor domain-containing protein [Firmicutes bacterium]|nr:LPXTG cell wall anchor domain-containing protein [Bacillota bacterium]
MRAAEAAGTETEDSSDAAAGTDEVSVSDADKGSGDAAAESQYDTAERNATVTLKLDGGKLDASVEYEDGDTPEFTNSENPTTPPPTPEKPPEKPKKPHKPATGDESDIMLYTMLMLLSLGAMAAAVGSKRRKNMR